MCREIERRQISLTSRQESWTYATCAACVPTGCVTRDFYHAFFIFQNSGFNQLQLHFKLRLLWNKHFIARFAFCFEHLSRKWKVSNIHYKCSIQYKLNTLCENWNKESNLNLWFFNCSLRESFILALRLSVLCPFVAARVRSPFSLVLRFNFRRGRIVLQITHWNMDKSPKLVCLILFGHGIKISFYRTQARLFPQHRMIASLEDEPVLCKILLQIETRWGWWDALHSEHCCWSSCAYFIILSNCVPQITLC